MGVTALNQDTKTTELLCGTCCQKKPSKNQNIIKATGTGEGPLTRFCMLSLLNPMGVFPYFLLVTEVTMSKSNSSSISCHFRLLAISIKVKITIVMVIIVGPTIKSNS